MRGPSIRETPFSTPRLTAERQISELKCHVHDNATSLRLFFFTSSLYFSLEKRHSHNVVNYGMLLLLSGTQVPLIKEHGATFQWETHSTRKIRALPVDSAPL